MAEYSAVAVQTVTTDSNVLFTETQSVSRGVRHREGSGIFNLLGITNQCRARYKVTFNANVANATAVFPVMVALAIDGEPLGSSTMYVTPVAVAEYFNVTAVELIDVPKFGDVSLSVKNVSTGDITVQNANIIIERVA